MTKLRYLPVVGMLLVTSLTVAACGTAKESQSAAAPSTTQASSMAAAASTPTTPSDTGTTAPGASPSMAASYSPGQAVSTVPPASSAPEPTGFANALADWKLAARASAAEMNKYLIRAAGDLRASGRSSYNTAINDLTYLAHLPATNNTPTQRANAQADVKALDSFFGTPGLLS